MKATIGERLEERVNWDQLILSVGAESRSNVARWRRREGGERNKSVNPRQKRKGPRI